MLNVASLNYLIIMLFGISISSVFYGFTSSLIYLILIFPLLFVVEKYFFEIKKYLYVISVFYFFLIVFLYYFNFKINDYGFFPHFDDSFYYFQGKNFLTSNYYFDSLFDVVIWFFQFIGDNNFSLSAINWFLSIIILGLVYDISKVININFKPVFLFFLALNMFFLECVVMLLRDFLGLTFLLLSIYFILKNKVKFLPFAILSMFVRQTTGVIAFIFYLFYKSKFINGTYKGKFIILLILFCIIYLFYNYVPVGFLSRSGFDGPSTNFSLSEWNKTRYDFFFSDSSGDLTTTLISLGLLGAPFLLILNIFTPLSLVSLFSDIEYVYMIDGVIHKNIYSNIFNYKSILSFIHIMCVGFFIIPFFDGFKNLLKKYELTFISLTFIICLLIVSYVSYQPRHRLHFLIFVPLICSYTKIPLSKIFIYGFIIDIIILSVFSFIKILS